MSLLFTDQTDTWALLLADTLVGTPDKKPYMFGAKVHPLPHLNMAIACLGAAYLGMSWRWAVDSTPGLVDIESVNAVAPETLRAQWADMRSRFEDLPPSATIYHHGFPAGSDRIVSYIYRSGADFEPERFEGSRFTVKPVLADFSFQRPQSKQEVIDLAIRVRDMNDEQIEGDGWGVRIGGDLLATMVENGRTWTERWHRFDDYEQSAAAMQSRMSEATDSIPNT